ncbi:hypothetical protein IDSA_05475 [Pseudidiomarina salinarum]|uniref:Uncharacterized protein n=1 Tax=Pseudidiomarina salinarum TaxID=435908 RepID=A0A094LB48_9GAMM|nr:hypothetical protein [Pseudidiomarina salinarum]KFZ32118.1 hypothetical protein IDSA_05475 [Pseudidiomarina salinarum]RUO70098.1 hypothetical protein CWI79_01115 [Pseudidiomarina salinarum]
MKLSNVLSSVNQVEKSKFLNFIDRICVDAMDCDKALAKSVKNIDGQLKNASNGEIIQLFNLVLPHFERLVRQQLALTGAQADVLVKILSRDGNCIAKISWIERLYTKELTKINSRAREIKELISSAAVDESFGEAKRLAIYHACLVEAFKNDERINREAKITDDERGILNVVARQLGITDDDRTAVEHLVDPVPKTGVQDCIDKLREFGLLFVSRKHQTIYVPDEVVSLLLRLQGRDLSGRHLLRILRTFSDAELSNVLKSHDKRIRGIERTQKLKTIQDMGLTATQILCQDMHADDASLNERKDRLKTLIDDLNLATEKLGTTIEERCALIIDSLNTSTDAEFNALSAAGYKELYQALKEHIPKFVSRVKEEYEIEDNLELDVERLKGLTITPHDILFMLSNEEVKELKESMGVTKRGNARFVILECFAHATDKLIEHYELLACRDLAGLKAKGIEISEPELGVKFEEVTKAIFEELGFDVDEDLRRSINTAKDQADIMISLSEDDIIIGEAKTSKNGDFAKYSSTSRQIKAYVSRCEAAGKRVAQVLIIAPRFSTDFIESAEMDTEVNISLLEADGLKKILEAYKARRRPNFSAKLLTKGGLLKADLIAKNI